MDCRTRRRETPRGRMIMANEALKEFFQKKKSKSGGDTDWQAKRNDWLQAIDNLYKKIKEDYLAGPISEDLVKIGCRQRTVVEEYIDPYEVEELVLLVGDERVCFVPKGMNIVGASGRIDLVGDMGEKTIVLQPGERWGIVEARTPTLKIVPLDEDSLLTALKEVMRR